MTDVEKLIAEARRIATKGVQVNDGHTYGVHAHDLVEYSETIMALIDAYEAEAGKARLFERRWLASGEVLRTVAAERDRYRRAIERVVESLSENEDPDTVVIAILAAALDETKED